MEDVKQDVKQESSSALGEALASSPEAAEQQTQEAQTPPAEQGETQGQEEQQTEEARVPYSRFKDVVEEKNWYKQQLEQRLSQQQPQQQQQPATNPYAGMTPEEERFWRAVDERARMQAAEQFKQIAPVIDAGRQELATMKVQQFRNAHPDIKPDSPEEIAIAEKINAGYPPEDAYKLVMWDRRVAQAEKQANSVVKQKIEAKKQANVEQSSIPQGTTAPIKSKMTLRERIEQNAREIGF
jgi:hypothetical protein